MERREVSLLIRAAFRKENYSLLGESWEGRKGLVPFLLYLLTTSPAPAFASASIHPSLFFVLSIESRA